MPGKAGDRREFRCWKFRTMVADAHQRQRSLYKQSEVDGPQFKMRHDPRVTWLGYWLRVTNIDELPQLFNVLLGPDEPGGAPAVAVPQEPDLRTLAAGTAVGADPGITGLWQICRTADRLKGNFHEFDFLRHCLRAPLLPAAGPGHTGHDRPDPGWTAERPSGPAAAVTDSRRQPEQTPDREQSRDRQGAGCVACPLGGFMVAALPAAGGISPKELAEQRLEASAASRYILSPVSMS